MFHVTKNNKDKFVIKVKIPLAKTYFKDITKYDFNWTATKIIFVHLRGMWWNYWSHVYLQFSLSIALEKNLSKWIVTSTFRSIHRKWSVKKGVLKKIGKIHRKALPPESLICDCNFIKKLTPALVLSFELWKIFKNTFNTYNSGQLFLFLLKSDRFSPNQISECTDRLIPNNFLFSAQILKS